MGLISTNKFPRKATLFAIFLMTTAIVGATINGAGSFIILTEKIGGDTRQARIVQLVSEAQRSRAPIQKLADTVAGYFVPAVVGISVLTFLAWFYWGPEPGLANGLVNAEAIEAMRDVDVLLVDKTGTLTVGAPVLANIETVAGGDTDRLLELVASLEQASEHPLAAAIVQAAQERGLELHPVSEFTSHTGKGVVGDVSGGEVIIGNAALLAEFGLEATPLEARADELRNDGASVMYVATNGALAGLVAVADPIKETTASAVESLRDVGVTLAKATCAASSLLGGCLKLR